MYDDPIRILLVDDDEDDYLITRDLLSEIKVWRYDLKWAASYDVALEMILRQEHDVYLIDYRLGERSGLELLHEAVELGCRAPMILLTGQGDHEVDIEAMKSGAADYLVKGQIEAPFLERSIRYAIERKRAEEEIRLLQTMTMAIGEAEDLESALGVALRKACEATGWVYGEAWIPSSDGTRLVYSPAWYSSVDGLESFRRSSEGFAFPLDGGLPGHARSSRQPVWMRNVTVEKAFLRAEIARDAGLKAGMAIPVIAGDEVVAVMVFFVLEPREEDERLVELVSAVAAQLGSVIQRKQAEDELRAAHEELRKAHEDLEQAQASAIAAEKLAAVGRLTAGVSHEILNPLSVITLNLHMLMNDHIAPPEIVSDLEDMMVQADRITKIAQDLLYFSRYRPPERRRLDFNEAVKRTLCLLEHDLRLKNIAVELKLAEELPPISADKDQLQQVVLNFLNNARDAMPGGGRLVLSTAVVQAEEGRLVELRVEDTGPGIAPEHMDKLFDLFFTTKPEGEGTGLGLSISHSIIDAHGGSIWAENVPGGGAAFVVRIEAANE